MFDSFLCLLNLSVMCYAHSCVTSQGKPPKGILFVMKCVSKSISQIKTKEHTIIMMEKIDKILGIFEEISKKCEISDMFLINVEILKGTRYYVKTRLMY